MRTIGVVTVGRSDFGPYRPILRRITKRPGLRLHLIVAGMHLSRDFGYTVEEIERDGFPIADRVPMPAASDAPEAISASIGRGIEGFARSYAQDRPDILVVLGDRFEMLAAAVAALPFNIPLAHIHGGETTEGAMDEAIRHSITKMSHLHFVAMPEYAARVMQLGEAPWRVVVSGAPGLDDFASFVPMSEEEMRAALGMEITPGTLLVTYHPVTLGYQDTHSELAELLAALERAGRPVVFTNPNADTLGRSVLAAIGEFVHSHADCRLVGNLGTRAYLSAMAAAAAMVGNSSSGIIEAASFGLPVVDIGKRQRGRTRGANVITVAAERGQIAAAIERATSRSFREGLQGKPNPYGDGHAADRIVERLESQPLDAALLEKSFYRPEQLH